jgi:hypothetical protein
MELIIICISIIISGFGLFGLLSLVYLFNKPGSYNGNDIDRTGFF